MAKKDISAAAVKACEVLLAARVTGVERPGGSKRESVRAFLEDRSVIATHRSKVMRGQLEIEVLRALHEHGAPVPRILASDGYWLIQEDLGGRRLSQVLADASAEESEVWLDSALRGLAAAHRAGRAAGLESRVPKIGWRPRWRRELVSMPARIANHLDLTAPSLPEEELVEFLRIREPWLIKWDARPGNATAREDGTVGWFDWEHCGVRNRLDDVAWLLGDEFVADRPEVEEALLERHLAEFADGAEPDAAAAYLRTFGTFHMCVRLALILKYKGDGPWWDPLKCLARDQAGVTQAAAIGVCARAARWASQTTLTAALAPWLETVGCRLEEL